ncbi:MAG: hypothetical protein AAGA54_30585 [Myxococcota bacterium]
MTSRTMLFAGLGLLGGCADAPNIAEVGQCRAARPECPAPVDSHVDPLRHLGRANTSEFIEITDIVADGETVYLCTGVRGLSVFDASAGAPRRLVEKVAPGNGLADGRFPRCQHVGLDADAERLVITNRGDEVQPQSWLSVFDVADPSRPRERATWVPDRGSIEGVAYEGNRIFAAMHTSGVVALTVDGDTITEVGRTLAPGTDAWKPVLRGDDLIVAEGEAGLRIYDVSGGSEPRLRATAEIEGSSRDVVLEGDRAYVATSAALTVVDIADLDAPQVLVQHSVTGTPLGVAVAAPGVVAVAEWDELRGYDVTDPSSVTQVFSEVVPTNDAFSRVLAVDAVASSGRVFGGEWTGLHQFSLEAGSGPEIGLNPGSVQFGTLAPGESDDRVLVVRNEGDEPLTVTDIVSADDVSVNETCFTVPPGGSTAVEVAFVSSSPEALQSAVRVCSDDPDEPQTEVTLSANIPGVDVGDPVPTFALQDLQGNTWGTADLQGKVTVLAYFATF